MQPIDEVFDLDDDAMGIWAAVEYRGQAAGGKLVRDLVRRVLDYVEDRKLQEIAQRHLDGVDEED